MEDGGFKGERRIVEMLSSGSVSNAFISEHSI